MKNEFKTGLMITCSAFLLAGTFGLAGCAGDRYHQSSGTVVDDAALTTKIKADLYADPMVKGHEVSVVTHQGVVRLNGFVDTDEQKQRAGEIAHSFAQVVSVENNIAVKPEPAGAAAPDQTPPVTTPRLAPKEHDP